MQMRAVNEELLDIIRNSGTIHIECFYEEGINKGYDKEELQFNIQNMIDGGYIRRNNDELIFIGDTYTSR